MCGIAGVFGAREEGVVRTMLATLSHRGPDDEHCVCGEGFTLGARRLSIIDVVHGRQPISNEAGDVWVAQNGEIYNFPALREGLLQRGHHLATRCDTEVLAHLYEECGAALVDSLEGMFAFAIWDARNRRGLLVRDRAGKKPLYLLERDGQLWFASELKALLRLPGLQRTLDPESVHHYLGYKHVPAPRTIFRGVRQLSPGHVLEWSADGPPRTRRWWSLDFSPDPATPVEDETVLVDGFLERFRPAVERRLVSDVPIGFFLSGGIDSTLVTAVAAEVSTGPLDTFTLVFRGDSGTEGKSRDRAFAQEAARRLGTRHHEEEIDAEDFPEELDRILSHFDEPFVGTLSSYYLARLIGTHVRVALSGDGADEIFGSYLSHRLAQPIAEVCALRAREEELPERLRRFEGQDGYLAALADPEPWRWRARLLVLDDAEKRALYTPAFREATRGLSTEAHLRGYFEQPTARDPLNRILEAEFRSFLPDQVLTYADRLSMAHSLEVRSPFLDRAVLEYVAPLPGRWKIRDGETKYLLKRACLRYLPEAFVTRPKEGFVLPVAHWVAGRLEHWVRYVLRPEALSRYGVFEPGAVGSLLDGLYRSGGDWRHGNKVLALVVFQRFCETYL